MKKTILGIALIGVIMFIAFPAQAQMGLWKYVSGKLQPVVNTWPLYSPDDFRFDDEIKPDGALCSNGQILKKTGADNWDCAADSNTTYTGGTGITLTGTVFSTTDSEIVHDNLSGFVANEHLDWTSDLGATNIHTGNYTNTTYTAGRSLTLAATTINADSELYKTKAKIAFEDPVATDDFFFEELATATTFTSIYCKTLVGTVTLDVSIAGSDINGVDIVCNTTGVLDSSLGGDTSGAIGEELALVITSVASDPTYLFLQVNGTYDD